MLFHEFPKQAIFEDFLDKYMCINEKQSAILVLKIDSLCWFFFF